MTSRVQQQRNKEVQEFRSIDPCTNCKHFGLDFRSQYDRCYLGDFLIKDPRSSTCNKFDRKKK